MVAVARSGNDVSTLSDRFSYTNNKYFIRFINIVAMNDGFDMMKSSMQSKEHPCNPTLVGCFMSIVATSAPYFLRRFVMSTGAEFASLAMSYVLEASTESLKNISKDVVENIQKAFD